MADTDTVTIRRKKLDVRLRQPFAVVGTANGSAINNVQAQIGGAVGKQLFFHRRKAANGFGDRYLWLICFEHGIASSGRLTVQGYQDAVKILSAIAYLDIAEFKPAPARLANDKLREHTKELEGIGKRETELLTKLKDNKDHLELEAGRKKMSELHSLLITGPAIVYPGDDPHLIEDDERDYFLTYGTDTQYIQQVTIGTTPSDFIYSDTSFWCALFLSLVQGSGYEALLVVDLNGSSKSQTVIL